MLSFYCLSLNDNNNVVVCCLGALWFIEWTYCGLLVGCIMVCWYLTKVFRDSMGVHGVLTFIIYMYSYTGAVVRGLLLWWFDGRMFRSSRDLQQHCRANPPALSPAC